MSPSNLQRAAWAEDAVRHYSDSKDGPESGAV